MGEPAAADAVGAVWVGAVQSLVSKPCACCSMTEHLLVKLCDAGLSKLLFGSASQRACRVCLAGALRWGAAAYRAAWLFLCCESAWAMMAATSTADLMHA